MVVSLAPCFAAASDHADPVNLTDPEANITGLFFYPDGEDMILILNVRRSLRKPKPYDLSDYLYQIHMDFTTPVTFDKPDDLARYGGTIATPRLLHDDATISIRLNDDTSIREVSSTGIEIPNAVRYSGVRDDPFVFPRFFKQNVISMALRVPKVAFPAGQRHFVLWATTSKNGRRIDHVGRSLRSQLPRFGFLNDLEPKDQVAALLKRKAFLDDTYTFFRQKREYWSKAVADLLQFTFQLRKYDAQPDVMIYSTQFPPGFPNGRKLEDDVVAQVCAAGDCLLQELSFIEGDWPRVMVNDKPFVTSFPYVAEQWPDQAEAPQPTASIWPYVILIIVVLAIVFWALVEAIRRLVIWLWRWLWAKFAAKPATAPAQ
ncbi:hypothetical protein GAO09_03450 [Rhizobiales bacterium RZME27]|uniref:Uncharacterized protein n=1 Tax=Endobacterium cereale TaxID=2663029 RepID=A0A6A8A269_9HYPH|nr:hypothetical protein [Endobacterium cereale]MEB2844558.1 hypothetical protein [Endobacterium cereale]MQY45125.1 hypothetical protein [Endobacterium cereale]